MENAHDARGIVKISFSHFHFVVYFQKTNNIPVYGTKSTVL